MSNSGLIIDEIKPGDYKAWVKLWDANNGGQSNEEVTRETWKRLLEPASPVKGLVARTDGSLAGLVHYIIHPVTGHIQPVAYMQDLYVDPAFRRKGIGRMLVSELAKLGKRRKWARLYWLAEASNPQAQALYKNLGMKLDFTLHVLPLA
jgi:ribosomal protein S18 acetylase RimI-like enzyme